MFESTGTMVEFQSNGATAQGYLVQPPGDGPFPSVIVIQEWWGLNDHIKDVADRFARAGFVALAPDLYGGTATTEPDEARKLAMNLDLPRAVKDMVGAVNYLCGLPNVGKIGAIGFCMGGSLVTLLATRTPRVAALASFYGNRLPDDNDLGRIGSPLLLIYAGCDQGTPPEKIAQNRTALERAAVPHEIVVYDQARHAFFNDTRPQVYDSVAAQDSWNRTLAFFHQHLQAA